MPLTVEKENSMFLFCLEGMCEWREEQIRVTGEALQVPQLLGRWVFSPGTGHVHLLLFVGSSLAPGLFATKTCAPAGGVNVPQEALRIQKTD